MDRKGFRENFDRVCHKIQMSLGSTAFALNTFQCGELRQCIQE